MPRGKKTEDPMAALVLEEDEEVLGTAEKDDGSMHVVTSGGRKWRLADGEAELLVGPPLPMDEAEEAEEAEETDESVPLPEELPAETMADFDPANAEIVDETGDPEAEKPKE